MYFLEKNNRKKNRSKQESYPEDHKWGNFHDQSFGH